MNFISKWLAVLALLVGPAVSYAQYTYTTIPTLGQVEPYLGINNTGQVVGNYLVGGGAYQPYIYYISIGILTPISVPTEYSSNILAGGINDSGQIVGVYGLVGSTPNLQGFSYSGGTFTTINVPADAYTVVNGINDAGQIVGYGATSLGAPNQAFLDSAGTFTTISVPGADQLAAATGINNLGQIVGYFKDASSVLHGFVDDGGTFTTVDVPGATNTQVFGINDYGQIVGTAWGFSGEPSGGSEAFVGIGGTFTIIDSSSSSAIAFGINNAGEIVGYDNEGAFLATPVSSMPTVTPLITGKLGTNGWYVSAKTTLLWTVTGNPSPITSGCATKYVPQTTGKTYTCSATNSLGSASKSVMIKKDSVRPQVTVMSPVKGKTYKLHQKVLASYSCLDATSGVATCLGNVTNGAAINTSTTGTKTFRVVGTDKAGNQKTMSVLYIVN